MQIQELELASGSAISEISKSYGINRESLLCNLNYYHIIDGIPPDIMHDILEGVLLLTNYCSQKFVLKIKNCHIATNKWKAVRFKLW